VVEKSQIRPTSDRAYYKGETEAVLEACGQGLALRAGVCGFRMLYRACSGGQLELARGLLELGAVVDSRIVTAGTR